ncbi:dol-P-Man:Man(5)GlcNAc(2)-PP-Dol alpha-1,3-mannosyltransferase [[Candida] railenensis]|uniref:Dol-P-Man:Man(5)GlcNAc(2)-PP-Dol alpha-1,3-mannosyltransferase n=1 Tax=[Candida] railenensis TaxID=45579 RepID=A0A9P0QS62_9ASCO|nr:dol-P-Man:Man(5)GlcNAc(2)-PP-Dol alpha-1,3-mannosyltransferase [[Candida] railenensis]
MPSIPEAKDSKSGPETPAHKKPELPEFTLKNVSLDILHGVQALVVSPKATLIVAPMLVAVTSILCKVIIARVPYTEIDFSTYMQQVELINDGELDYAQIYGDSGPIVYPAGFVQVYQFLYSMTDGGQQLRTAQYIFSLLLTSTTFLTSAVYITAGAGSIPPWPFYLLVLSKRLFSIYLLRLFNDCFTTIAMIGVTLMLQQASYWYSTAGTLIPYLLTLVAADLFSLAISVKMNALLYLPGFVIVSYFLVGENLVKLVSVLAVIPIVQVLVGWKFLLPLFLGSDDVDASNIRWNYINQAFDFSRKFLYKWTVNWKFISEDTFLSDTFANTLLILNVATLLVFIFTRFLSPKVTGKPLTELIGAAITKPFSSTAIKQKNLYLNSTHGPRLILLTLACSNVIGVLFARSLHYQFLSWYCWQLPYLLYSTGWNFAICGAIWAAHEYSWNVFPATAASSGLLVSILSVVLFGVWNNRANWFVEEDLNKKNQ